MVQVLCIKLFTVALACIKNFQTARLAFADDLNVTWLRLLTLGMGFIVWCCAVFDGCCGGVMAFRLTGSLQCLHGIWPLCAVLAYLNFL
jgi:hypothetical protein